MKKEYLGDGVYAEWTGYKIVLTIENGVDVTNTISLDLNVCFELIKFMESIDPGFKRYMQLERS